MDIDVKSMTEDELTSLRFRISSEMTRRGKTAKKECYKVTICGGKGLTTYFKSFAAARDCLLNESDYAMSGDSVTIEQVKIDVTEYKLRPDVWYS